MKWIAAGFSLALGVLVAACGGEEPGAMPVREGAVEVEASQAVVSHGVITIPATVSAGRQAELATRMSGTIREVHVNIGAEVTAGQPLVTLATEDIEARIRSAEAAAELARRWYERITALAADGAATAQELDDAEARLAMAEAGVRDARAQLEYAVLRAPFAGVVTARRADPGDLAVPGRPVLEMIGRASLKIEAAVPAELGGRLSVGDAVTVVRPDTGERLRARLTRVVSAVEPRSRRFRVEARFEDPAMPDVAPGTFVRIELEEGWAPTRWIPADAVVRRGQLRGVYVVEGDVLRLRWVRLGRTVGDAVELLAGPGEGARLVRRPAPDLSDGQRVSGVREVAWSPPALAAAPTGEEAVR